MPYIVRQSRLTCNGASPRFPIAAREFVGNDKIAPIIPAWSVDEDDELAPWESQFARWLGLYPPNSVTKEEENAVVAQLYGRELSKETLSRIKRKVEFRRVYEETRAEQGDLLVLAARNKIVALMDKGIDTYDKAVSVLNDKLGKPDEAASAMRAAAPLLAPILDRAMPRKTEAAVTTTHLNITLSAEQLAGLSAPVMVVEAEEVKQIPAVVP